ncbi:MAG TPA: outer-membrane lipoprotein carrier protein LolA [bacterium]|jgi:outer membrane lipoprotein-sorting protein|nr:outer-membrane lipoprotein carrier protein LolA [bacterium]
MKALAKILTGLFLILSGLTPLLADSPAPALSVKEICQKVQDAQDSAQDIQMKLEMTMKDTLSGQEQHLHGLIQIKSPDKVFVHYEKPNEQFLYVNGGSMQMYQPAQKTVYVQKNGPGKDRSPFYVGVGRALKKYMKVSRVSITKDSGDEVVLLFIPLDDNEGFDRMKVSIHKKDWWPYQMEVETTSTNSKANFKDFVFNKGLADSLFKFTPPKDAQVVEGGAF